MNAIHTAFTQGNDVISSFVVRLEPDLADAAIAMLAQDPRLTLGELTQASGEARLPVVAETHGERGHRDLFQWIDSITGVVFVDVVFVHFGELAVEPSSLPEASRSAR